MADGILILNKPEKMTSHDAVNKIRRIYKTKQVGHAGTLDPMATGVLCVLVGRAVKASEYAVCDSKEYRVGLKLGFESDTEDIWGEVVPVGKPVMPAKDEVVRVARSFIGDIMQVPPMYSALKRGGVKLADLARRGVVVEREARSVKIYDITVEEADEAAGEYIFYVSCSKGTYMRTLCADIGRALGTGGVMSSLVRTKSGSFSIDCAKTFEELENMSAGELDAALILTERLFCELPSVVLPEFFAKLARSGCEIYQSKIKTAYPTGTLVTLYDADGFFAVAEALDFENGPALKPRKQFRI